MGLIDKIKESLHHDKEVVEGKVEEAKTDVTKAAEGAVDAAKTTTSTVAADAAKAAEAAKTTVTSTAAAATSAVKTEAVKAEDAVKEVKYKIKYGDTLSQIAVDHGTTVKKLMEWNPHIKDANKIKADDTIVVKK